MQRVRGKSDPAAAGGRAQRRESGGGAHDHRLRRNAGDAGADHRQGGEGGLRGQAPSGKAGSGSGPDRRGPGGTGTAAKKAGTDRFGYLFLCLAVCVHGADAALRPARPAAAGSVFHAHPPYEFRRFTAHAGDPGALLRAEFLYQRLSGTVPRESQHGFAGGHRLCLLFCIQCGDDVFDHRRCSRSCA